MHVFVVATLVAQEPNRSVFRALQDSGAELDYADYTNLPDSETFLEQMATTDLAIFLVDRSWKAASAVLFRWLQAVRHKRTGKLKRLVRYDLTDPGPAVDHMLSGKIEWPSEGPGTSIEHWHTVEFEHFLDQLRAQPRSPNPTGSN